MRDGACFLAGQPILLAQPLAGRGPALLMLRPERLRLLSADSAATMNRLAGHITGVVYQGDSILLQIALRGGIMVPVRIASTGTIPTVG